MSEAITFSTKGLSADRKVSAWQECLSRIYFDVDVHCESAEKLTGGIVKRSIGSLGITHFSSSTSTVKRTAHSISRDKIEEYCFVFPLSGSTTHKQRGLEAVAAPGQMYFLNGSEPYDVVHSDATELVCLTVPCELLRLHVPRIDDSSLRVCARCDLIGSTLMNLVSNMVTFDVIADARSMEALCLKMIDLMLRAVQPDPIGDSMAENPS